MSRNKISFEESMVKLEAILTEMESGKLSLDESILAYENAVAIISSCRSHLEDCRRKVEILKQNGSSVTVEQVDEDDNNA